MLVGYHDRLVASPANWTCKQRLRLPVPVARPQMVIHDLLELMAQWHGCTPRAGPHDSRAVLFWAARFPAQRARTLLACGQDSDQDTVAAMSVLKAPGC